MRRVLGIVLIALFALRSLVPAGVMLRAATPEGPLEFVICSSSAHDTVAIPLDLEQSRQPSQDGSVKSDLCAFSTISAAAILRDTYLPLAAVVHDAAVQYRIVVDLFSNTPRLAGRSARGPPGLLA